MTRERTSRSLGDRLERRRLVTWEQRHPGADLLTVTNAWPHAERPAHGPFVKRTVEGLEELGIQTDVLFIRGYEGIAAYTGAALLLNLLNSRRRYALVHAHGGETALAARFYTRAPLIASYLGSDLLAPREAGWRWAMSPRVRGALFRQHSRLTAATTTKTRQMEALLPSRVKARNRVIADGVDLSRFEPVDREQARALLGWPSSARVALFAGRAASPIKRLWLAERAVALAQEEIDQLELVVASEVAPEEMPYYYCAADCLLHTSASEGSPNVVKEALACNLPVVATAAGDIEQLLSGTQPGGVVDANASAIAQALVACCREPVRSNGRSAAWEMSAQATATATIELYRALSDRFRVRAPARDAARAEAWMKAATG